MSPLIDEMLLASQAIPSHATAHVAGASNNEPLRKDVDVVWVHALKDVTWERIEVIPPTLKAIARPKMASIWVVDKDEDLGRRSKRTS